MDDGTMNLDQRRFGRLVSRHAVLIVVCLVIGAIVAAGITLAKKTTYTATTQLRVANPLTLNDVKGTNTSTGTVVTVSDQIAVLGSDSVKDQVKARVGQASGWSAAFSTPGTGQVVTIRATADNGNLAGQVATAYTQTYLDNLAVRNTPLFTSAVTQLNNTMKTIATQVSVLQEALKTANSSTLDVVRAQIDPQVSQLESRYSDVSKQLDAVTLAQKVTPSGNAAVVSAPTTKKDSNGVTTILIGGLAGLLIGLLIAGFREARFGRVVDANDVERFGLPVVANIQAPLPRRIRTAVAALGAGRDTVAYREAAVLLAPPHAPEVPKRWLITSADRDGIAGAVLAGRLARHVSQLGRRVVLVDCAAESPARSAAPGLHPGLAEVLRGEVPIAQGMQLDAGSNVAVMTPGAGLAALPEPLASATFAGLLDSLGDRFDVIVITGAPFERSADAYVLAPLVNLLVVSLQRGVTRRKSVEDAASRLSAIVGDARCEAVLVGARKSVLSRRGPSDGEQVVEKAAERRTAPLKKQSLALNRVPLHGTGS